MGNVLDEIERKERSKYPSTEQIILMARSQMAIAARISELLYGASSVDDAMRALQDAGAWCAAEDVCPVGDWLATVMPHAFDDIEFGAVYGGSAPAMTVRIGKAETTILLPYLLAEVVRGWLNDNLQQVVKYPEDYGFERYDDGYGVSYSYVPKPTTAAA